MKRTLQVELETARQWYNSKNQALKELALQVFSEAELTFSYSKLLDETINSSVTCPATDAPKVEALIKLSVLAKYFNKAHASTRKNGFFLAGRDADGWIISEHTGVQYPGIVYFKKRADVFTALQEFTEAEIEELLS